MLRANTCSGDLLSGRARGKERPRAPTGPRAAGCSGRAFLGPVQGPCCLSWDSLAPAYDPEEMKQDTGLMGTPQWLWLRATVNWESQDMRWSGPRAHPIQGRM